MSKDVKNPCISDCKVRDGVCRGCGRAKDEIKGWKAMKNSEKKKVVEKANKRLKKM